MNLKQTGLGRKAFPGMWPPASPDQLRVDIQYVFTVLHGSKLCNFMNRIQVKIGVAQVISTSCKNRQTRPSISLESKKYTMYFMTVSTVTIVIAQVKWKFYLHKMTFSKDLLQIPWKQNILGGL